MEKHQKSLVRLWKDYFEYNGVETPSNDQDWITSQKYFTHQIPQDNSTGIRYSLTSVLGQTIGLIWKGIIEGLKR